MDLCPGLCQRHRVVILVEGHAAAAADFWARCCRSAMAGYVLIAVSTVAEGGIPQECGF
jgi:hypothetical protein